MEITNKEEKKLRNGSFIHFDNEHFCNENELENQMGGHIQFNDRFNLFAIFLNGACLHTSKGMPSINRKLSLLEDKFSTVFKISEEI